MDEVRDGYHIDQLSGAAINLEALQSGMGRKVEMEKQWSWWGMTILDKETR